MKTGNLFSQIPDSARDEIYETLLKTGQLRLERIVSFGQKSPPGEWYDQEMNEWVILLHGNRSISSQVMMRRPRRHYVHVTPTSQLFETVLKSDEFQGKESITVETRAGRPFRTGRG